MEITIDKHELKEKAVKLLSFAKKKKTISLFEHILFVAEKEKISMTCLDGNLEIGCNVAGEVITQGKCLIHYTDLGILLKMNEDQMHLEIINGTCKVLSTSEYSFSITEDACGLPLHNRNTEKEPILSISEEKLDYTLKLRDITTKVGDKLSGIWFQRDHAVACNEIAAGIIYLNLETQQRFMIPDYMLEILPSYLRKNSNGKISFYLADHGKIEVYIGDYYMVYRQYDGVPGFDLEKLFKVENPKVISVNKKHLTDSVDLICQVFNNKYKNKYKSEGMTLSFEDDKMTLSFTAEDKKIKNTLNISNTDTPNNFKISFQPNRKKEVLKYLNGESINITFGECSTPTVFTGENLNEQYLLLPIFLRSA